MIRSCYLVYLLCLCASAQDYGNKPPAEAGYPAPPPPPPAPYMEATSPPIDAALIDNYGIMNQNDFPLPSCYLNDAGYLCCNKEQEMVMNKAYDNITQSRGGKFKKCNIHQIAVKMQDDLQEHFKMDFESVSAAGDFASKSYFSQDFICKIKRDDVYMLSFATPVRVKPAEKEKYVDRPPNFANSFA
ncbi:hypothetical protein L596_003236 [Steinernema carpocapsae]|uniref:Ground-like domain-containing protein n=1 Tax=Steinernema carpocapsae TaxID=34508 RepID=A0A4U8USL7_STECR|nr:hypothetical protein L596_003236 [Steinernema carpocapsae]